LGCQVAEGCTFRIGGYLDTAGGGGGGGIKIKKLIKYEKKK
jgi:hypothetical protein